MNEPKPLPLARENLVILLQDLVRVQRFLERELNRQQLLLDSMKQSFRDGRGSQAVASSVRKLQQSAERDWAKDIPTVAPFVDYIDPVKLRLAIMCRKQAYQQYLRFELGPNTTLDDCHTMADDYATCILCEETLVGLVRDLRDKVVLALEQRHIVPPEKYRLTVSLDPPQAVLDGEPFALDEDQAAFVKEVLDAGGDWISGSQITKARELPRPDRVRDSLPRQILELIESAKYKGYRLPLASLRQK